MNDATQTLVIINSVVLIVFLIIAIFTLGLAIRIMRRIDRITQKTESAVNSIEEIAKSLKIASTPLGLGHALGALISYFQQKRFTNDRKQRR